MESYTGNTRTGELPRLTGSLRVFSNVFSDQESYLPSDTAALLERKREKRKEAGLSHSKTWPQVSSSILKSINRQDTNKVEGLLKDFTRSVADLIGEEDESVLQSASVHLFSLFSFSDPPGTWCKEHGEDIRKTFGPYPASIAMRSCGIVGEIHSFTPNQESSHDGSVITSSGDSKGKSDVAQKVKEFGSNITSFQFNSNLLGVAETPVATETLGPISDDDDDAVMSKVTDDILAELSKSKKSQNGKQKKINKTSAPPPPLATAKFGTEWLQERCKRCGSELPWEQLYQQLFELLLSETDETSLQVSLVELVGFSSLEFVQELLVNREKIVDTLLHSQNGANALPKGTPSSQGGGAKGPSRPTIGCQVSIKSQEEKALEKKARKEGRKEERQRAKREKDEELDHLSRLKQQGYDPELLKKERERALEDAKRQPLFKPHPSQREGDRSYPNVYDSMATVKITPSFLAGKPVGLPAGSDKKDHEFYEEVVVPHSAVPPPFITEKILIKELDDIPQMAFKGTKSLNTIQSAVFDTAYYTNENLLISAPTGAGKTNIAMLTILREINNNIDAGVIRKDKFKIIYVAPMKALAAEVVRNFSSRLLPLGISVRELTGDMQLTKYEIQNTQMIVTTPEKWDVVTRKSTGDVSLSQLVRLLIIDEVHLLHEDRGAVIECLVARTLRQVETSQRLIRIVGLSATLPNYLDVARFLHVNLNRGLFYFDGRFRPVPLMQVFSGVKSPNPLGQLREMDRVCYNKVFDNVRKGHQVMVFVHARNATVKTAMSLKDSAVAKGHSDLYAPEQSPALGQAEKQIGASGYKPLRDLFSHGFAVHHAGMLRKDRNLVEKLFSEGLIKVLVCTATLAWGVNLPAHTVIIKGTQIYDAKKGSFVDIGILDVMQIFGRAGRPQFDTFGEGHIITTHDLLSKYVSMLTQQQPIESQLMNSLADSLNAEISLGTVSNIEEAVTWLSYTYFYVRLHRNPLAYGVSYHDKELDPTLEGHQIALIQSSAKSLDKAKMIRYAERNQSLSATDLGRIAANFYIKYASIEIFNELFKDHMTESDILSMISQSQEFEQIKVRDDELSELDQLLTNTCLLPVKGGTENVHGKVNILIQAHISQERVEGFSLVSDLSYVSQNATRIIRGVFEIALKRGSPRLAYKLLCLSKSIEHRLWIVSHPLRQFERLSYEILQKLEGAELSIERMKEMSSEEIGLMVHHVRKGKDIKFLVESFPSLSLEASIQPITRSVLRVRLSVTPTFTWSDRIHGNGVEPWWVWVEDPDNDHIYHSEYFLLQKKQVLSREEQVLSFTIPIFEPLPTQYIVKVVSDRWLGAESVTPISFRHLILPETHPPHTKLLDLHPLPVGKVLKKKEYAEHFKFKYFNPIQSQIFHTIYHSDSNVLLGAPTGSGKTVAAELAMFRVFEQYPGSKCVYIAPLKALVRERIEDWSVTFGQKLGRSVIELTGDTAPDSLLIEKSDVIVTTPEKWDGISRSWQNRKYVKAIRLIVIDEIHLLGDERGPVLEVIVSRTNFISSHTQNSVRIIGLSTALANAGDLGQWLNIGPGGLFNFHPAVRPVQLEVHIHGFPGKHYCPRMATMNKPAYSAIKLHSPEKPVLIFVSSRRQTRLTGFDLASYVATEPNPKQWLHIDETKLDSLLLSVRDTNLRFTLPFGIGLHHAGLHERDRKLVEELFVNQKIQILIATATLAWGVNFPAHLVIVKGTEYYDGKTHRYVDYPITDVLQMMGRAGRPQYDDHGVASILVQDLKKDFYKKFLYEPFPVESSLLAVLPDHLNAEIVSGTVTSKQDALDYLTWTYFFRRLVMNPSYYQLEDTNRINHYLTKIIDDCFSDLLSSYCIRLEEDERSIEATVPGCIASFYYLHHKTMRLFSDTLHSSNTMEELLKLLCDSSEYAELPVRHNEDQLNETLASQLPLPVSPQSYDSSHTKAFLLFQAHFSQAALPIADYLTDTKSVLDQSLRILQAMIDLSANEGWLQTTLKAMSLVQMCVQGLWSYDSSLLTLPHVQESHIELLNSNISKRSSARRCGIGQISSIAELLMIMEHDANFIHHSLAIELNNSQLKELGDVLRSLPMLTVKTGLLIANSEDEMKPINISNEQETIPCSTECILSVIIWRDKKYKGDRSVYCPRFPKTKPEGWWLCLGNADQKELIAMKRIGPHSHHVKLNFVAPPTPCHVIFTLYVISDCYLGLDQQYDLKLTFV
ncbi:PREDICTED: activating signal cointegrator 1 complex subunit 3-like [Amphimedon queenslandica]|uniref:Activating signal cointegrator 1 complex subunit 3 n=2 Tax=Amphimedon queenslandica TaxID=400682 RepID=A0AAN0J2W3_AMPQE|nr:PREDICTED: activating signal cointegrator 1 complex subunit 3-like [Amphimedon queenslandica]|eukprot:XP_019851379.1 PREDICTED: activating signal cointegrator 1 complex subunit 3-like [Amphimedon queenslandica]